MDGPRVTRRGFLAAAASAIGLGLAGCAEFHAPAATPADSGDDIESPTPDDAANLPTGDGENVAGTSYTRVYQQVRASVTAVRIRTTDGRSQGTAWMYDDDHLVTNQHVVEGAETVSVWFNDAGWREASVVATDVYSDLGVLDVTSHPDDADPLPLVSDAVPIGTQVLAIGNPFGLSGSVTAGIVSGVNRTLEAPNNFSIPDAIQFDAAVNPGNSGGPLVTQDGEVVGVVNAGGGDNIGFAISAAMVRRVVPALIRQGGYDHSFMGIALTDVTPPIVQANGLTVSRGVYVNEVIDGGPSDGVLAGSTGERAVNGRTVPVGGDVILQMGQARIATRQDLSTFLALHTSPGDTIPIKVLRDGRETVVNLTLGSRPEP